MSDEVVSGLPDLTGVGLGELRGMDGLCDALAEVRMTAGVPSKAEATCSSVTELD